MKAIRIFLLPLVAVNILLAQPKGEISGRVIDHSTGEPVFYVNVFLANTTIGSTTDNDGRFRIAHIPPGIYNLVVQHIAYELEIKQVRLSQPQELVMDFQLRKKVIEGREIEIIAEEPVQWKRNYEIFKKMFLGSSENASKTRIENPEVLSFTFSQENKVFKAYAEEPLDIINEALGYRLQLLLRSFSFTESGGRYRYYAKFDHLESNDPVDEKRWEENRKKTYIGSFKHFLATIARNEFRNSGFAIHGGSFVISRDSTYLRKVYFDKKLWVTYKDKSTSAIEMNHDFALIDQLGNLISPLSITKSGDWYEERIADLLPWDYYPNEQVE